MRKLRTLGEEEEEEDNDDVLIAEDDMVDEEEVDDMENDEVLEALSVGIVILNGTRVPVPQICTLSTEAQLPSALQAVRTAPRPRPSQLTAGGEWIRTGRFTLPCFHGSSLRSGQYCSGLVTTGSDSCQCCCKQATSQHKLCGGEFFIK